MARRTEIMLDRRAILDAAFHLLEERGLDRLTMRAVAERLSVQPPALYWHLQDKAELVSWMAQHIMQDTRHELEHHTSWREWIEAYARRFVRTLVSHRDSVRLWEIAWLPAADDPIELGRRIVEPLTARGLSEEEAHAANASVMAFALGWAAHLSNTRMASQLGKFLDIDGVFDRGLTALLDGLAVSAASPADQVAAE